MTETGDSPEEMQPDPTEHMLTPGEQLARKSSQLQCARDVCDVCGDRKDHYLAAEPSETGVWIHNADPLNSPIAMRGNRIKCAASSIYTRMRMEAL